MDEFELIRRFFADERRTDGVRLGIGDDGAVLQPTPGKELVAVVDTLIEAVHFPVDFAAEDLGYRSVAVNLSDIAAMGAIPRWMTLALTLTQIDTGWLESFSRGIRAAADEFAVALVGGDTTRGEQISVTVQVLGESEPGRALRRGAARPGDAIFVSGSLGDAAAGLSLLQARSAITDERRFLIQRFCRPTARVRLGQALVGLATAAIDVSDGLLGDAKKLLAASRCGASLELDRLPLSTALSTEFDRGAAERFAMTGGDDYELCFCVPAGKVDAAVERAAALGEPITRIGSVEAGQSLVCKRAGRVVEYDDAGYSHF